MVFYPSDSEVKTLPLSEERVKHSSEGCFSGSPKIFQAIGYFFSVRLHTYQIISLILKSLANVMILKYYLIQKYKMFGHAEGLHLLDLSSKKIALGHVY